jgi:hypothetical protein
MIYLMMYVLICANCGKGEETSISLKACTACKLVKYCNQECQIAHRPNHKKECKRRAAELHDEKLFKQPPPKGDCPICFQRMPSLGTGSAYYTCCGKMICSGCVCAPVYDDKGNIVTEKSCPFCRTQVPAIEDEELIKSTKQRVEAEDSMAIINMGGHYANGSYGLPQDYTKALQLWHRAGKLGNAQAYYNIAICYVNGKGVEIDKKKATHYYELAAMGGDTTARHILGCIEGQEGNIDRVFKHFVIAVKDGYSESLESIRKMATNGKVTKDDYTKALKFYQAYLDEIKSDQRDKVALAGDKYKYIE